MRIAHVLVIVAFVLAPLASAGAQSDPAAFGPAIGSDISEAVSAPDAAGTMRTIADLTGDNGLVLYFNRSVDWCPFCKAQAIEIDAAYEAFASRGYAVVVLTTDTPELLARYVAERDPSLTLISDAESEIIGALGLLDPEYPEGHRRHGLPFPTALVLSPAGVVQAKLLLEDMLGTDGGFRDRVTVEDVTAAIDALDPQG